MSELVVTLLFVAFIVQLQWQAMIWFACPEGENEREWIKKNW
jgi:hypothetical protein